jgi:hypothetical protein
LDEIKLWEAPLSIKEWIWLERRKMSTFSSSFVFEEIENEVREDGGLLLLFR